MWMERSICGIEVVSMAMRVELFKRGIELLSEREKLSKDYWLFVIFLLGFVIDLLLIFLLRLDL